MSTASVVAAQRYGRREAFDLIAFKEVGLPLYRLNATAIVMAEKALPAMQEFVLRAIDAEMDTVELATALLGLQEGDLDDTLFTLVSSGLVRVRFDASIGVDRLKLTPAGAAVSESFRLSQAEERTYLIDFDGLLRRPVPHKGWAVRPRRLSELGAMEIAPSPPRRPTVDQLSVDEAEAALRESKTLDRSRRLLELTRINRAEVFFVPATMLVFRAKVGDEVQVSFVIDGRASEPHDLAFAAAMGPDRLALLTTDGGLETAAKEVLGGEVGPSAIAIARLEEEPPADGAAESEDIPTPDYQMLETYDHPLLLDKALRDAQSLLVIVSPWIKNRVVDDAFVGRVRNLLRNGVDVYVGYGFGEAETQDDQEAVRALGRLAEEHPNFVFRRFGDTHAKVLICDDAYAIVTSFNWLSFVGDPRRTFRDERGMLIRDQAAIRDSRDRVLGRFV
jgi:hypothetical protein